MQKQFQEGQYVIYQNGDRFEIGKIKRIVSDGAFVYYSAGDTAAKTPFDCMHPIQNGYVIWKTSLGGKTRTDWQRRNNPNYSPFDGSGEYLYTCSGCGGTQAYETRYCPDCGAEMKEAL